MYTHSQFSSTCDCDQLHVISCQLYTRETVIIKGSVDSLCRDDNPPKNKMWYKCRQAVMIALEKEQCEGKGKGWACNNHNMPNPSLHLSIIGLCCCMPISSCCSLFLITACLHNLYCILFLYFLVLSSLYPLTF